MTLCIMPMMSVVFCLEYDSCTFYGAPSPSPNPNSGAVTGNSNGGVGMLVGVSVGGALLSCCFAMIIVGCCCYLCRKRTQMKKCELVQYIHNYTRDIIYYFFS